MSCHYQKHDLETSILHTVLPLLHCRRDFFKRIVKSGEKVYTKKVGTNYNITYKILSEQFREQT